MYTNNRTRRKWNQVLLFLVSCHFVKYSISSPIFSSQFSQFQAARNIRNLPCVVRKSGLRGVCMFAIDCIKSNGTHLGTCIDKFYFGSCCQMKLQDVDTIYNPEISDNSIDSSFPDTSYNTNSVSKKPFIPVSSSTPLSTSVSHIASNYKTTSKPAINYNNKTFELIPTTRSPSSERTTSKNTVQVGGFSTTLGTILQRNESSTLSFRDQPSTTTEGIKLSTFQTIQDSKPGNVTTPAATKFPPRQPASTTHKKPITTKPSISTKKPVSSQTFNRTSVGASSTVKATRRPATTTTLKPSKNATSTVIKPPRKPVAPTNVTVNRRTTISSRRNSTFTTRKPSPSTRIPSTTVTTTPVVLTTISFVQTTKAPRPRPTPTDMIVKVEPTTLSADDMLVTTFSVESADDKTRTTTTSVKSQPTTMSSSTSTVKSTSVTRRPATTTTATTTTAAPSTTTTKRPTTHKKPLTEPATSTAATTRDETTPRPLNLTTTTKAEEKVEIPTTLAPGLVTWTLGNAIVGNSTKGDSWVLVPSVTPSEAKTESPLTMETKIVSSTPTFVPPSGSLTNEILLEEEATEKTPEPTTTVETTSSEEYEDSSEDGLFPIVEVVSETLEPQPDENEEEEEGEEEEELEEETTTGNVDTEAPINTNLTSSTVSHFDSTTTPASSSTLNLSSSTELSPDDSSSTSPSDPDTTMWSVTQRANDTETEEASSSTESSTRLNETMTTAHPSSTIPSLEGVDFKTICGKRMFPEPRIVGGAKAAFGRWPWQISLRQWRTSTYLHKCGSALLNENWAISAAHCVDNVPPSDLLLRMGEYDLSIEEEPYGYQERRVQIVASHPQFDPRTFEYDLALLRFFEPVVFQPNIIPVCVPENDEDFIGRTAYVTGWGRLYEDGPLPSVLQEVTVPIVRNDICESMYRNAGYIEHIPHIFICAGHKQGAKDSCEGDSGGPMVIQRTDKRFQLAGIISWGIGCAEPNQPGVYTRISEFRDWINQILMF